MREHDRAWARELAGRVDALPNECYRNAVLALAALPCATYVEGLLVVAGCITIYHGWVEVGEVLLDVTLHEEDAAHYVPVLRYSLGLVLARMEGNDGFMVPLYDSSPALRQQMIAAERAWWQAMAQARTNGQGSGAQT